MGTVLVARMAPLFKRADYAAEVTRQQIGFAERLRDPRDGLNYHGYNDKDGHVSCCKWGRGQCTLTHLPIPLYSAAAPISLFSPSRLLCSAARLTPALLLQSRNFV
eukprot:COSAG05_NODE_1917_length_3837_cov_2.903424_3_plen_106_part_00